MGTMLVQYLLNQQVLRMSCVAMFAAFPSAVMEAAFSRHHNGTIIDIYRKSSKELTEYAFTQSLLGL
jgi:hypothetical protein